MTRLLPTLQAWLNLVKDKQRKGIPIDLDAIINTVKTIKLQSVAYIMLNFYIVGHYNAWHDIWDTQY